MPTRYYKYPLNFKDLTSGKELQTVSLPESIAERIHLILVTNFGEFRSDRSFGCSIWDNDFELITDMNYWKDKLAKSVKEAIERNEKRLGRVMVLVDIHQEEFVSSSGDNAKRIKNRLDIKIFGRLVKTNEDYNYMEQIYISPVWVN